MDPIKREAMLKDIVLRFRDQAAALWLVEFAGANGLQPGYQVGRFRLDGSVYEQIGYVGN
jgi:hypothetical protein